MRQRWQRISSQVWRVVAGVCLVGLSVLTMAIVLSFGIPLLELVPQSGSEAASSAEVASNSGGLPPFFRLLLLPVLLCGIFLAAEFLRARTIRYRNLSPTGVIVAVMVVALLLNVSVGDIVRQEYKTAVNPPPPPEPPEAVFTYSYNNSEQVLTITHNRGDSIRANRTAAVTLHTVNCSGQAHVAWTEASNMTSSSTSNTHFPITERDSMTVRTTVTNTSYFILKWRSVRTGSERTFSQLDLVHGADILGNERPEQWNCS